MDVAFMEIRSGKVAVQNVGVLIKFKKKETKISRGTGKE